MATAEHPILFSGAMVRAILAGTKTQTRRLVNSVAGIGRVSKFWRSNASGFDWTFLDRRMRWNDLGHDDLLSRCPHGAAGDRLWVRETWTLRMSETMPFAVFPEGGQKYSDGVYVPPLREYAPGAFDNIKWRPSIHMPRWASRITLEVTDVRVQRLQDITDEDAKAEGVVPLEHIHEDQRVPGPGFNDCRLGDQPHRLPFAILWDEINGKRAPWEADPWVWAIEFERVA